MRKITITIVMLFVICTTTMAQNYASSQRDKIRERARSYQSDPSVSQINDILAMFDRGQIPDSRVLSKTYAHGIVYILSKDTDCKKGIYSLPAINAALFQCSGKKIGVHRMRPAETAEAKRPLTNYVQQYLRGYAVNDSYNSKHMMEYQGIKVGLHPYVNNGDEFIVSDSNDVYIRQYGNDIFAITASNDYSEILLYRFRIPTITARVVDDVQGCQIPSLLADAKPTRNPFQREYTIEENFGFGDSNRDLFEEDINEYFAKSNDPIDEIEYNANLSDMIEQVINNKAVKEYCSNGEMYIVSSGLFKQGTNIKYRGENIHVQSIPTKGKNEYFQFLSLDYDGKKDHDTTFKLTIPCSNVSFIATFRHNYSSWALADMLVIAE